VTEEKLTTALDNRRTDLSDADRASIGDLVATDLRGSFNATVTASEDRLRGELTDRLSDLDARVGRAVGDAIPALRGDILSAARAEFTTTLDTRLRTELDATRTAILSEAARQMRGVAQEEAKGATDLLRRDIDVLFKTRTLEMSAGIMAEVQVKMDTALSDQKNTFDRQLTAMQGNLLPALVRREVDALQPELQKSIDIAVRRRQG
jgi:hypothetical protein